MDTGRYQELKDAQAVSLQAATDGSIDIICNVYDQSTGKVIKTQTLTVTIDQINTQIAALQAQIDSLNTLIKDIQVLLVVDIQPQPEPVVPVTP